MAARAAAPSGRYLYAIVTAPGEPTYGFAGIDLAPVYTIANGQVAAVQATWSTTGSARSGGIWLPSRRCSRD